MIVQYQLKREEEAENSAKTYNGKVVVVCDRSIIDPAAYIGMDSLDKVLSEFDISFEQALKRYNLVIHLETAAKGASDFYTLENNNARSENINEAISIDDKLLSVWSRHPRRYIIDNNGKNFEQKIECMEKIIIEYLQVDQKQRDIR